MGAINRFRSVPKLISFVYADKFNEFDFKGVPVNYWNDIENIKNRLEYLLAKNNYSVNEIPTIVTYDQLVEWGFSNPLKRYNDSPYTLINALYPKKFNPYQFRKVPQRAANDKEQLIKHRFNGALKYCQNSPLKLIKALFPNQFDIKEFNKPNGFWKNSDNVKDVIINLIKQENIPHKKYHYTLQNNYLWNKG